MKLLLTAILILFTQAINGQQKMVVSLDRPHYIAGQTINCAAYLIDPFTKARLGNAEDLTYFQLFDAEGIEITTNKVIAIEGIAVTSISLPENLKSGNYELVVYTNYLRNITPEAIFRQPIKIFNVNFPSEQIANKETYSTNLYPEGGGLTDGLTSRVAVLVSGPADKTANLEGVVIDDYGKEVSSFITDDYGLANFYFKPQNGREYRVRITHANINEEEVLPYVQKNGLSITAKQLNTSIQVILACTKDYAYSEAVEIRLIRNNAVLYSKVENISKNGLILKIPSNELTAGQYDLEVRNRNNKLEAYRALFVFSDQAYPISVPRLDSLFDISTHVDLHATLADFNPQRDMVITSITDQSYHNQPSLHELGNQLYLNNQLSKVCFDLGIDFSKVVSAQNYTLIDQVMLMKRQVARSLQGASTPYERETGYYYLKGTLTDSKPLPDSTEIFFYIPEINMIYQIKTDQSGRFSFPLLVPFYGKQKIMFFPHGEDHEFKDPQIVQHDRMQAMLDLSEPLTITDPIKMELEEFKKVKEIRNSYGYYKPGPSEEPAPSFNIDEMLNYDYDFEIKMSEYVLFGTMQEVIKELLPGVMLRTRKQKPYLRIYAKDIDKTFEESPMIFIGGFPTKDVNDLLKLRPVDIKYIRTVENYNKAVRIGPFGVGGIMVIELNEGVQNPAKENTGSFEVEGLTYHSSPLAGSATKGHMPQFDYKLLWYPYQPESQTLKINVNSSERPSEYVLKIDAVINGCLYQYTSPFNVRFTGNSQ